MQNGERTRDLVQLPGKKGLLTEEFAAAVIRNLPPAATSVPVSVPSTFVPPAKPTENLLMSSPKPKAAQRTVGVDLFVDCSELHPPKLAETISKALPPAYHLVMLSNRGTQVWPTGSKFTECVNHYRCRVELKDMAKSKTSEPELLTLASEVSKKVRVCSLEMLMMIGEERKYTLAQGQ